NVLRASPVSFLVVASVLQVFIFCCCELAGVVCAVLPLRQSLMKLLRMSPDRFCCPAWVLHAFMRSCWLLPCADAGPARKPATITAHSNPPARCRPCRRKEAVAAIIWCAPSTE